MIETDEWTLEQFDSSGLCEYCQKSSLRKREPFGDKQACKPCWEQICYGEE